MSKYAGVGQDTAAATEAAKKESRQGSRSKPGDRKLVGLHLERTTDLEISIVAKSMGIPKNELVERMWAEYKVMHEDEVDGMI